MPSVRERAERRSGQGDVTSRFLRPRTQTLSSWSMRSHSSLVYIHGMPRLSFTWHLAVILLLAAAPRVADACSCWKRGLVESCELSDAVFEGKVVKVVRDKPKGYLTATFAVTRRWKGALQAQVKVMTGLDSSMCGLSFDNA